MQLTRRSLQLCLGVYWLVDAALQAQSTLFRHFADEVIRPAAVGQPHLVAAPARMFAGWVAHSPTAWNTAAIAVSAAIGVALLTRRFARPGLAASVVVAVALWWLVEACGGVFGANANLISGAPGPAILLGVLALAAWPAVRAGGPRGPRGWPRASGGSRSAGGAPAEWLVWLWAAVWIAGAALQATARQRSGSAIAAHIRVASRSAPDWLARLDLHVANVARSLPTAAVIAIAIGEAAIGLLVLRHNRWRRTACGVGTVVTAVFWALGQAFGGVSTGRAVNLGAGPLLALTGFAILSAAGPARHGYSSRPLAARAGVRA